MKKNKNKEEESIQSDIDKKLLKYIFSTQDLERREYLLEYLCKGNASKEKAFVIIYNALDSIDILNNGKLHKDYVAILDFEPEEVDLIIDHILVTLQKYYTEDRIAFFMVNPKNKKDEKINKDALSDLGINTNVSVEINDTPETKNEILEDKDDKYGDYLYRLKKDTQELLYGIINKKSPEYIEHDYNIKINPLKGNQKISELAFKNIINIILKNDMQTIDDKSIYRILDHYMFDEPAKDNESLGVKKPASIRGIKSNIIKVLKLLEIIIGDDENKSKKQNTVYTLKVPKESKYLLGADTKTETIFNIVGDISRANKKEHHEIEMIKYQIMKIFDFVESEK